VLKIKIEKSFNKDIARDKKSGLYSKNDFELLKIIITNLYSTPTVKISIPLKIPLLSMFSDNYYP